MAQKYFTVTEANALLPMVQKELKILQQLKREYHEKYYDLKILKASPADKEDEVFKLECQLEFMEMEAEMHVSNIHSQGIQLKDIDNGLIDFPARNNDGEVLLCWKQGEDKVCYYYGTEEGFIGRKMIKPGQFEKA